MDLWWIRQEEDEDASICKEDEKHSWKLIEEDPHGVIALYRCQYCGKEILR